MNDTPERWLPIPGFEGRYDVSDLGRVRSLLVHQGIPGPRLLRQWMTVHRYLHVKLYDSGRTTTRSVHSIVLAAFVGRCPEGEERRHLDDNRLNNRASNLAYGTSSQNMLDQVRNGVNFAASKTHCKSGHPFDDVNTYVTPDGRRNCRTCLRAANMRWMLRHRTGRKVA